MVEMFQGKMAPTVAFMTGKMKIASDFRKKNNKTRKANGTSRIKIVNCVDLIKAFDDS